MAIVKRLGMKIGEQIGSGTKQKTNQCACQKSKAE
jgi:hypothetical protein